jgi:hypothetical protein
LRRPALLAIPLAVALLAAAGLWWLYRRGRREELVGIAVGEAFFLVALLPSLNLAVDLNNANGERLLFLPSVGLVIAVAAVARAGAARARLVLLGVVAVLAVALLMHASLAWVEAGRIADRVVGQTLRLGPDGGTLVLLSVPEAYRNAHVFPDALDSAVDREGGRFDVVTCLPVQVVYQDGGTVSFVALSDGAYRGRTSWSAPFDFPVLRGSGSLGPGCGYERADGKRWPPGLGLVGRALPAPLPRSRLAYFDGRDLRPFEPAG